MLAGELGWKGGYLYVFSRSGATKGFFDGSIPLGVNSSLESL